MVDHILAAGEADAVIDRDGLDIAERWFDRVVVLAASGVVDALTAPRLAASISAVMSTSPVGVIVDLSGVDFLASAGMGVLLAGHDEVAANGRFGVVADGRATSRLLILLGLDQVLDVYGTLKDALVEVGGA